MDTRGWQPGDLMLMLDLISELWPDARHGPGYAFMAQRLPHDDWDVRLCFEGGELVGWGWSTGRRTPVGLSYELRPEHRTLLHDLLAWSRAERTTVRSGDDETAALLESHGFAHDPDAPWLRLNARSLDTLEDPVVPDGYRLTTMAEYPNVASRAAAHRSAFTTPQFPSRFTDEVYACVRSETNWRADLDCVVVAPDGSVAAYALAWLDERNRLGELEPVGVRVDEQRNGLGRAVCLYALQRLRDAGAATAVVGSRGDDAYPVPRKLYESIGFRELWRELVFTRAGS
jgi:ribosomal protein S18 acetylase RimI-like enzyme